MAFVAGILERVSPNRLLTGEFYETGLKAVVKEAGKGEITRKAVIDALIKEVKKENMQEFMQEGAEKIGNRIANNALGDDLFETSTNAGEAMEIALLTTAVTALSAGLLGKANLTNTQTSALEQLKAIEKDLPNYLNQQIEQGELSFEQAQTVLANVKNYNPEAQQTEIPKEAVETPQPEQATPKTEPIEEPETKKEEKTKTPVEAPKKPVEEAEAKTRETTAKPEKPTEAIKEAPPAKELPKTVAAIEIEKQIEANQKELTAATNAMKEKAKELDKGIVEDNADLFGERKSDGGLLDVRVDPTQREKTLQPFKTRIEKAKKEGERLKKKLEAEQGKTEADLFTENPIDKKHLPKKQVLSEEVRQQASEVLSQRGNDLGQTIGQHIENPKAKVSAITDPLNKLTEKRIGTDKGIRQNIQDLKNELEHLKDPENIEKTKQQIEDLETFRDQNFHLVDRHIEAQKQDFQAHVLNQAESKGIKVNKKAVDQAAKATDEVFEGKNTGLVSEVVDNIVNDIKQAQFTKSEVKAKKGAPVKDITKKKVLGPKKTLAKKMDADTVEDAIAIHFLNGGRFNSADLDRYGDPNVNKGTKIYFNYGGKNKGKIDDFAKSLAETYKIDEKEAIQRIIEFTTQNPSGPGKWAGERLAQQRATKEGAVPEQQEPESWKDFTEAEKNTYINEDAPTDMAVSEWESLDAATQEAIIAEMEEAARIEGQMLDEEIEEFSTFIEQFEDDQGNVNYDALAEAWNQDFNADVLNLSEATYSKIDNLLRDEKEKAESQKEPSDLEKEAQKEEAAQGTSRELETLMGSDPVVPESSNLVEESDIESLIPPEQAKEIKKESKTRIQEILETEKAKLSEIIKKKSGELSVNPFQVDVLWQMTKVAGLHIARYGEKGAKSFSEFIGSPLTNAVKYAYTRAKWTNRTINAGVDLNYQMSYYNSFIETIQNADHAIRVLEQKVKKAGYPIPDKWATGDKRELWKSRSVEQMKEVRDKVYGKPIHELGAKKSYKESIAGRMAAEGLTIEDLGNYMAAKHAPQFNERVKQISTERGDKKIIEDGSGWTNDEADKVRQGFVNKGQHIALERYANEFRETVLNRWINTLKEGSMISAEVAEQMRTGTREGYQKFDHYVPLNVKHSAYTNELLDVAEVFNGGNIKSIKGTDKFKMDDRYNPIDISVQHLFAAIQSSELNKANKAMHDMIIETPGIKDWKVVKSQKVVSVDETGNITINDYTPSIIKEYGHPVLVEGQVRYIWLPPQTVDGRTVPHPVINALKWKDTQPNSRFIKGLFNVLRTFNNIRRAVLTSLNLGFTVPNFTRDIQDALGNLSTEISNHKLKFIRARTVANLRKATWVIMGEPFKDPNSKMAKYWQEARAAGMKMNWSNYEGAETEIAKLNNQVSKFHENKGVLNNVTQYAKSGIAVLEYVNNAFENAVRLSAYAAMRDQGVSPQAAAAIAKNLTLNFEKKGRIGGKLNSAYLFLNAGIQGASRTSKLLKSKRGIGYATVLVGMSYLMRLAVHAAHDDDETKDLLANKLKETNNTVYVNPLALMFPDQGYDPLVLPKPYSLMRAFMGFGESIADVQLGYKTPATAIDKVFKDVQIALDPIAGSAENKVSAFSPSIVRPMFEVMMNIGWHGSPILKGEQYKNTLYNHQKTNSATPAFANKFAEGMYDWTGIDVSPAYMDYLYEQYVGGGLIKEAENMVNTTAQVIKNEKVDLNKLPVARKLYVDMSENDEYKLYFIYSVAQRAKRLGVAPEEIKMLKKNFRFVERKKVLQATTISKLKNQINEKFDIKIR